MKNKSINAGILAIAMVVIVSCKKDAVVETPLDTKALSTQVLNALSVNSNQATYNDLQTKSNTLYSKIQEFTTTSNQSNLLACQQLWKDTRSAWEQSEGFLYGPVSTNNIDPRIDTWPVNYTDLDSILTSGATFTTSYMDGLEDALKGFHPIEYLIFGLNGNKDAADFTPREKEYLLALAANLNQLTSQLASSWNPSTTGNYHTELVNAGGTSTVYPTTKSALEEIVNSMIGICDEVANAKMEEPFANQDPALEESPFSQNSLTDFTNNIKSVQNVYFGQYGTTNGLGLEDLIRGRNLSLHNKIISQMDLAIQALGNITIPFGQAIFSQQIQVTNAQKAIKDLKTTLESEFLPFIQLTY